MAQKSKGSRKILKQKIAVIGIGRVGLPLAIFLADHGQIVHGIDVDQQKINIVSRGKMPFLEEGAQSLLKKYVNKTLSFSSDFSKIKDCQVLILTLGTPVDENMNPSLTQIDNALEASKPYFKNLGIEVNISDDISAELAKLFTNMYRYINFAIANEFMILAGNYHRDIYKIVDLVNRNYKRGGLALPGLTGGPCLFKDGFFLVGDVPFADLITTSWKINESVPLFLIKKVRERTKLEGKKAVILGLSFKAE